MCEIARTSVSCNRILVDRASTSCAVSALSRKREF